ncbi:MAG: histidinol-phosphate transaminase [Candidatus Geothermincolales bacterium]
MSTGTMGFDPRSLAREEVIGLPVYSPGRSPEDIAREYGIPDCVKMASNENPLGPSPRAMEAISRAVGSVHLYPDPACTRLREAIAAKHGLGPENVLVSHGADEVFDLLAFAFFERGDRVVVADPTFSSYELAALTVGAEVVRVPLRDYRQDVKAMAEAVDGRCKAVFLCSPHNPTGTTVSEDEFAYLLEKTADGCLVILDEAYVEYVDEDAFWDSLGYLRGNPHLLVTRTFSKIYGLAGLRVGYALCWPEVREILEKVKLPFNVNRLAQEAALAALEDAQHVERSREVNSRGKEKIYRILEELGVFYVASQANFILVKDPGRGDLFERLLRQGVIVRDGAALGMPGHVRITVGDDEQNARLEEALRKAVEEPS